jgi:hypothetical protein
VKVKGGGGKPSYGKISGENGKQRWLVQLVGADGKIEVNAVEKTSNIHQEPEFPTRMFKRLQLNDEFDVDYWDMHKIHCEAIIMEHFTASPSIINIFGHCSVIILAKAMGSEVWKDIITGTRHVSQEELDQLDDVFPPNNYTVEQKLDMAIEMAKALADMHGYDDGIILHGDAHRKQWLLLSKEDSRLILNAFNNAVERNLFVRSPHCCFVTIV